MNAADVIAAGKRAGKALVALATRPDGTVDAVHLALLVAAFESILAVNDRWARRMAGGSPSEEPKP